MSVCVQRVVYQHHALRNCDKNQAERFSDVLPGRDFPQVRMRI